MVNILRVYGWHMWSISGQAHKYRLLPVDPAVRARAQDESKIFALLNVGNPQIRGIDIALCMHGLKGKQPNQSNSHYQVTTVIIHVFALLE